MIYDCFTFYNEWDILDLRMHEVGPVVDRTLIVMGSETFQGDVIPDAHDNAFRILESYENVSVCTFNMWDRRWSPWEREYAQRNQLTKMLEIRDADPNDIVLLSDVDEIPRRENLQSLVENGVESVYGLLLDAYFYHLNTKAPYQHIAKVLPYRLMTTAQEIREQTPDEYIHDAGWHFSYIGSNDFIINKIKSYAHSEFNYESITNDANIQKHRTGLTEFWSGEKLELVEVDDSWPKAVVEDPTRWSKFMYRP